VSPAQGPILFGQTACQRYLEMDRYCIQTVGKSHHANPKFECVAYEGIEVRRKSEERRDRNVLSWTAALHLIGIDPICLCTDPLGIAIPDCFV
jgi:hypothetical protein